MLYFITIALTIFVAAQSPARAADPSQIFGTILGEINRQIERKQRKRQHKRLRPLITACSKGDITACDRALEFRNLTDNARNQIWRMRMATEQRPDYERNFYACQKMDVAACDAALQYEFASDTDRRNLQKWQNAANQQRHQALAAFRRLEASCYNGSISDCDAALAQRPLNETALSRLQEQRNRLQYAHEQRLREERRRREQQRADQERRERERLKAQAQYKALRQACETGTRSACVEAASHAQVLQSDIAFLNRREQELAPIAERAMKLVASAVPDDISKTITSSNTILAALGFTALCVIAVGIRRRANGTSTTASRNEDPPWFDPEPDDEQSTTQTTAQAFPLTGHMPTDVRRALYGQVNEGSA